MDAVQNKNLVPTIISSIGDFLLSVIYFFASSIAFKLLKCKHYILAV